MMKQSSVEIQELTKDKQESLKLAEMELEETRRQMQMKEEEYRKQMEI